MKKTLYLLLLISINVIFSINILGTEKNSITLKTENLLDSINISSVAVNTKGEFYLYSNRTFKVFKFKTDGTFEKSFGQKGEGPGEFTRVLWMFHNPLNDDLYFPEYASPGKGKVTVYDKNGNHKGILKLQLPLEDMDRIYKILVRNDGSFILELRKRVGWETIGKLFKTQSEVYIKYINKELKPKAEIFKVTMDSELTHKKGWGGPNILFKPSVLVKLTPKGNIAITSTDQNKIDIFDHTGKKTQTITIDIPRVKLTEDNFKKAKTNLINQFKQRNDPRMLFLAKKMIKLDYKPFYSNFYLLDDQIILTKANCDKKGVFTWKTDVIIFDLNGKKTEEKIIDGWIRYINNKIIISEKSDEDGNEIFTVLFQN